MLKSLLLVGGFTLTSLAFGQTNYEITELGTSYSQQEIEVSLNAANLCGFHYSDERRSLYFNDGAVVQLFKKDESVSLDDNCFIVKGANVNDYDNTWEISASGHLIRRIAINPTK